MKGVGKVWGTWHCRKASREQKNRTDVQKFQTDLPKALVEVAIEEGKGPEPHPR